MMKNSPTHGKMNGALISGVAGINIPLGAAFVGVEGNATKGFSDIDWEYGVKGRFGARAGDSGPTYASAGYQWVNGKRGFGDQKDWIYGLGVEVGPRISALAVSPATAASVSGSRWKIGRATV